jgi:hypothetical protein
LPAGLGLSFRSLWPMISGHGSPPAWLTMMMVVTVMAEGLHLTSRYGQTPDGVKWFVDPATEAAGRGGTRRESA